LKSQKKCKKYFGVSVNTGENLIFIYTQIDIQKRTVRKNSKKKSECFENNHPWNNYSIYFSVLVKYYQS